MKKLGSEALLLLTAAIWGFAFVAQRQGMEYLSPLFFNGIRFTLGAIVIGIVAFVNGSFNGKLRVPKEGIILGTVLFLAASLQQIGIVSTTAGNAGFITGLYVVFVPILGIFRKQKLSPSVFAAIGCSLAGLVMINLGQDIAVTKGNLIVLAGAVFWALHVQLIDKYTHRHDTLVLAFWQFAVCALLSLLLASHANPVVSMYIFALVMGTPESWPPILYSGLLSIGVAFTLQLHAQKRVAPAPATIILCLEGAFALLGGWLLLKEPLTAYILLGAALLFAAMLLSIRAKISKSNC